MTLNRRQFFVLLLLGGSLAFSPFSIWGKDKKDDDLPKNGYTINYNTVSIIEYIKFASKICNVNFIFNEEDLQFTVTVVSDAPITEENVMATLLQTLRIHGLSLLEQDNSLVIHKNNSVRQPASLALDNASKYPIVTRVFRVKNANPSSVAAIVRPMISDEALLEVSQETRQVILTDVTGSVEKVAALIENLDAPHSPLEISSFEAKFNKPEFLIDLAHQIMVPIAQGNPFILVPQSLANTIFIVSTPELNEKAQAVLTSLDTPPKKEALAELQKRSDVLVVRLEHRQGDQVLKSLKEIAASLQQGSGTEPGLVDTIDSAKWIADTNSLMFVGTPSINVKLKEFIAGLDQPGAKEGSSFFVYKPQYLSAEELQKSILEMADNLAKSGGADEGFLSELKSAKVNPTTNTIMFTGDPSSFPRIRELLANADTSFAQKTPVIKSNFFVYRIQKADPQELQNALKSFASNLSKANGHNSVVKTIDSMKYIEQTNSLLFTGPDETLKRVAELVSQFDAGADFLPAGGQFLIYKPKAQKGEEIVRAMKDLKENLQSSDLRDPRLLRAIDSMKWVKNTHSIIFTGDPASLKRVEDLLATIDITPISTAPSKNFIMYKPQYASKEKTETYLKQIADHLNRQTEAPLIDTIRSMKWIEPSQSFMFYGTQESLERINELLTTFDTQSASPSAGHGFILYALKYASEEKTEQYIDQLADNLSKKDANPALISALRSRKWVPQSNAFMFSGSDAALARIKELLDSFDTISEKGPQKPGYVIYKVQNTTGDLIEEDLENLIKNMKATGMKDSPLVKTLENIRYVKETNSLLITGDEASVKEAEALIAKHDTPHKAPPAGPGNFFLYKPQHASATAIEKSLRDITTNLKKSSLADPGLLSAIDSMKYVETTNSLVFTGSPEAIQKVQMLLKEVDIPPQKHAPIQHVGKTTFLLYKLQHASPNQITTSLKAITNDLKKSGAADKEFVAALNSMKYVKETNSLMFTGTDEALAKVQVLVEKFDVTGLAPHVEVKPHEPGASNFFIYRPQSLSGADLEKALTEFSENLKTSGLDDPSLFRSIATMKYVPNTQSLVFTGDKQTLDRIKELLKDIDIPANLPEGAPTGDQQIQAIDNTSFLVYKLQFHKGDEIQGALRQIAKDLLISNAPINQNLLNSINSIQWLEVTNSLLCSGDQETLTRLRELIKNLDIPLKQVFIEILVLQTSLTNAVDFGLEWGGKVKYKNKFSGSFNNLLPTDTVSTGTFSSNLQDINASTNLPVPTDIPFSSGFDLGVIGDIIMHKGNSFLSLGSLISAIQTDDETTIVLTPKLITQDSKTSSIFVGQNVPFAGSFISNQAANTVSTSNLEYRDIGFNLTITPVLGNSDIITMEISIDSSSEASLPGTGATFTFQAGQATGITTNRATLQTTVHIPDKHFLILSGMVNNSNRKQTAGIPCLGGIPVIGAAFSQNNVTDSMNSLVIFMRPTIVNSLDDMKTVTSEQEDFFRTQAGTPYLEHNFDEAMEFIKSPDDDD